MNSLNILSARVIGQTPPSSPTDNRQRSFSETRLTNAKSDSQPRRSTSLHIENGSDIVTGEKETRPVDVGSGGSGIPELLGDRADEKTHLLLDDTSRISSPESKHYSFRLAARRLASALSGSLRRVLSTLTAPGVYIVNCFYDERGNLSLFAPMRKLARILPKRNGGKSTVRAVGLFGSPDHQYQKPILNFEDHNGRRTSKANRRKLETTESFSSATSDSELDAGRRASFINGPSKGQAGRHLSNTADGPTKPRRSIRIRDHNEGSMRQRKDRRAQRSSKDGESAETGDNEQPALTAANLKSPTSPASSSLRMTKYPRAQVPPRPLIPMRQPSYSSQATSRSPPNLAQKTLVIDLDETLIHSLAKGGRMSSGHMVEVKLNTAVGFGGASLGPQHPILYYVHKRPHCDEFLRKVCKWYNLIVFTASVQEYADPVIDWLEQERKYFSARYYRQHCTFRNGAYIKDLSSVEPDLSKVMILDNSPLSYIFHEGMNVANAVQCNCLTFHSQTTQYPSKAGSMIRQTMIFCTSSQFWRDCNTSLMCVLCWHYEKAR